MHGFASILFPVLGICLVVAFLIELVVNRRPFLVALLVGLGAFALLVVSDWDYVSAEHGVAAGAYAVLAFFGGLAALVGSGIARFLLLWLALGRDIPTNNSTDGR